MHHTCRIYLGHSLFEETFLQLTRNIPRQTSGSPTIRETVNSSLRKSVPKRTPKMGPNKVKADSLLTE
jgi:hypothetical protein